ncbi:LLM class flavin-dependent oxidoreductase [Streptantibioticus ferralitis]|uniref:LLM class flavin-dependent oxidoreductase n=1 Tax=Streptantibioticus ferralitis TaxID=236510 RepID=A0ABT5YXJ8_9ACTN|nr:LLM class flavin-dependent oxidoreductase [Streptantibioticus ferralitis]MDF2255555.1 LLM class flavin-dependent oxidoreductase [Streptantibioticus ferralitis]
MRFAISIPQFYADGDFDPNAFRAYLTRVEQLGFDSAWAQEQTLGSKPLLGPIEIMTCAAACTQRLRLGCAVFVSTLHSPVHLAKSISSLDQISRGRIEIGFGTGGKGRPFAAFGVDPERYVARFTEGIEVMTRLWRDSRVDFAGEFWQLADAAMEPKPFQKPCPPLWFGGSGRTALRRAVLSPGLFSGFFGAGQVPTAKFADQVQIVRRALAESGRPTGDFAIAKRVYIAVDDDAQRARDRINAELAALYMRQSPEIEAAAIAGTPGDCVRQLREVVAAGAELVLFTPLFAPGEHAERLAAEVMPEFAVVPGEHTS